MPSHITHKIFAERTLRNALSAGGNRLINQFGTWVTLGAQGPDMFLHNQMTEPSSFSYGKRLHTSGYGRFVRCMLELLLEQHPGNDSLLSTGEGAFIVAYTTHAVLDRYTHPFIMYFSGWVETSDDSTKQYHQCHPFFERILDIIVLHTYTDKKIGTYDFLSQINFGPGLPENLHFLLADALNCTYGENEDRTFLLQKVANGYKDMLDIYGFTNPSDIKDLRLAYQRDQKEHFKNRLLALFHPRELYEEFDFPNLSGRPWVNPCAEEETIRKDSFFDLFQEAEKAAVPIVTCVADVLENRRQADSVEEVIGNTNLSDGGCEQPCVPRRCNPFPLSELIDDLYKRVT